MIKFIEVDDNNLSIFYNMQKRSFLNLYNKYNDKNNPYKDSFEKIIGKYKFKDNHLYIIEYENKLIGGVCIKVKLNYGRVAPVFVLPEHQSLGLGKEILKGIENKYSDIKLWELDTIKEETGLVKFYEKLGYFQTGKEEKVKSNMHIVYLEKRY